MSIRIGLIDSGIDVNNLLIKGNSSIIDGWKGSYDDYNDLLGHGTQCANLILKSSENVKIYNIKVFNKNLVTSIQNILNAINWCIDNNINLINLSLSITNINYYYEFKQICTEAYNKNIVVVAAADNAGRVCLPAYLDNVLGVGIAEIENESDYFYNDSQIQLYLNGKNSNQNIINATSFATARMTGIIANILIKNLQLNFSQIVNILSSKSLSFNDEKILIKNEKINFDKCIIPIQLSKNPNLIVNELENVNPQHIVKDQITKLALINVTNNVDIFEIEIKIRDFFVNKHHKIAQVSSNTKSTTDYIYSSIPEKFNAAYAKAIIEYINNNSPESELIIIGINKPIVPLNLSSSKFLDSYSTTEISLLFGFQPDISILIINELCEFKHIQKNINSLKNLFDSNVIFLIYNSLCENINIRKISQNSPNLEQIKKISDDRFMQLQKEIKDKENLMVWDINDEEQKINIWNAIIDIL